AIVEMLGCSAAWSSRPHNSEGNPSQQRVRKRDHRKDSCGGPAANPESERGGEERKLNQRQSNTDQLSRASDDENWKPKRQWNERRNLVVQALRPTGDCCDNRENESGGDVNAA